jgi:FAD-dependent urate hydroxylase
MDIAILGGGVAGVSSAIALKQKGFNVSIYERRQAPTNIGAGIVVWPNAAYVLDQLGVLNDIKAASGLPTNMRRVSNTGEFLGSIDIELINQQMGYPSLSILRRDLQNILISTLKSLGVEINYSHAVTDIKSRTPDQAEVYFQNGRKITADVFVGADGRMASIARQHVHGDNSPVYQGFINWIGVYDSEEETFPEITVTDYWGVGARFGIVPISKHKAYWAGGIACPDVGPKNPAEYKAELSSIFSSWPQPVQKMIEQTPLEWINKIYVHDHNPIPTWHNHNLIAIGDAAHAPLPTSGQGACQALEDAWHLANCLTNYITEKNGNLEKMFILFTSIRFEKTTNIILAARNFAASLFNRDERFCQARNQNSRNTDYVKVATAMSEGWGQRLPVQNGLHRHQ